MKEITLITNVTFDEADGGPCAEEMQLLLQESRPEWNVSVKEISNGCPVNCCKLCTKM